MKNKIFSSAFLGVFLAVSMYAEEGTIATRKENQQARIAQGVKSGELTPKETVRIERKEARLNHQIRDEREDGGGKLTPAERKRINQKQNRLSRSIYRQKHDAQDTK